MVRLGVVVRLHAKPGKEAEVAELLACGQPMAQAETFMPAWFAFRGSHGNFYIVDVFEDETGREWHLSGSVAHSVLQRADLFDEHHIEKVEVLAGKLPG